MLKNPVYAAVGAGDALVTKVREVDPEQLKSLKAPRVQPPQLKAPHLSDFKEIPDQLKALPDQLRGMQAQAQTFAAQRLEKASATYAGFAERGETLVDDVRGRDVVADVKGAVAKLQETARPGTATSAEPEEATAEPAAKPAESAEAATAKPEAEAKSAAKSSTKSAAKKTTANKTAAKKTTANKTTKKTSTTKKSE